MKTDALTTKPKTPAGLSSSALLDAFVISKDTMNGQQDLTVVYLDKRVAEMKADSLKEEWADFKVRPIKLRVINETEGVIGRVLVTINRETADDAIRAAALSKLTKDERRVLGV